MFGHSEKRDGDLTTGEYNVLLPDGRKQVRNSFNFFGTGTGSNGKLLFSAVDFLFTDCSI